MPNLAPVVLFVYNRPKHCLQTLQALKNNILASDSILYIFADGYKENPDESEKNAIIETRNIIRKEKWCKEVIIYESELNKGLAQSIINGVSEIVEKYGKIIVLEDDIVTSPFFLQYMNDALNFYEKEQKVWHISGYAHKFYEKIEADTFFTKHMTCWGWATWADRWKFFEKNPKAVLARIKRKNVDEFRYKSKSGYFRQIKSNISGRRNTWAAFWYSTIFFNDGLCLNSKKTFTQNIGMDGSGVHCGPSSSGFSTEPCENYPIEFERNICETTQTRILFEKNIRNKKLFLMLPKGQHSNRLVLNLNFHAFCLEHGIEYRNPTLTQSDYYLSPCLTEIRPEINLLRTNLLFGLFRNSSFVKKHFSLTWLASLLGFMKFIVFNKNIVRKNKNCEEILLEAFEKNFAVFTGGWCFRVPHLIEKHRDELVKRYSLKPQFYENNDFCKKIMKLKQEENVLIGIHIRRGDYKKWRGGRYYFEDDVYEKYMNDFSQKLSQKTTKKQIFIVFSNDKIKFTDSENMFVSKESWYIDHHMMSICDYLIGPLSTFTLWASYIGKNTRFCIQDASGKIENTVSDLYADDFTYAPQKETMKKVTGRILKFILPAKSFYTFAHKDKILCSMKPFNQRYNAYVGLMQQACRSINIEPIPLKHANCADFIWYHWIENRYENPATLPKIKKHVANGKKIIWNLHNKVPHMAEDTSKAKEFMKTMAEISHKIVIHCSETIEIIKEICGENQIILSKVVHVSHPNYIGVYGNETTENILQNSKLSLCFFGAVKKYKNIELLISAINELNFDDVELSIIGRCRSKKYALHLKNLIGKNRKIKTDFRFIKDTEIPQIMANCQLLVLPYNLNSSLNSGATILAFSYGRSVLSSETGTLADIKDKSLFFTYFCDNQSEHKEKLKGQIIAIREKYKGNYNELLKIGKKCKKHVSENNSMSQTAEQIIQIFSDS
ncbi:MAG: alpha-1,2-fucosyltransferase [Chitinispirillales bacterium]|nr:alpha-1,2-fucosyltransferase [Chitinispirillales bacterium]